MKSKPAQHDLDAFPLFVLEPGMIYWASGIGWCRFLGSGDSYSPQDRSFPDPPVSYWAQKAIDVDDPATQGCMLRQLSNVLQPDPVGVALEPNEVTIMIDGKTLAKASNMGGALAMAMGIMHKVKVRKPVK